MSILINSFAIKGLFGHKDVLLTFTDEAQIYVGENGLGKTTILNALFYTLSFNFKKLSNISFSSIEMSFSNKKIEFSKDDLLKYLESLTDKPSVVRHILEQITSDQIGELKKISKEKISDMEKSKKLREYFFSIGLKFTTPHVSRYLDVATRILDENSDKFASIKKYISENIKSKILYFPTYRRIEEDLENLGISKKSKTRRQVYIENEYIREMEDSSDGIDVEVEDGSLIQFGMTDVEARIKKLTRTITQLSVSGFSKLTGDMLIQLLRGYSNISKSDRAINIDDIKIILNRVGDNLSNNDKDKIIDLIATDKIFETKNNQLVYFLDKLLEIYKSQYVYDKAIKDFKDVCNKYLNEKQYEYNESTVDLNIFRNASREIVPLAQLSSGEKQIVSLFSKIFLEPESTFIVLFDEPELSLSLKWQEMLLPDILRSGRCDFLLAVTHSPFIFENDLAKNARGLKECFKYMEKSK